jgi:hypothetical protein
MPGTAMVKLVLYTGWEWEEVSRLRRLQDFDEQEGEDHEVLVSQGCIEEEQISYWWESRWLEIAFIVRLIHWYYS